MTTARLVIVAAFACWGAVDIARRLLLWSDRVHRDLDAINRNKATRRTLGDVAKYRDAL
jgi:hypothetical protein